MPHKCLFPIAGYGTRFLPVTKVIPKEMLPIVNKPLIQYGVEEAYESGMSDMIMITARGKEVIADYFDISYEVEQQLIDTSKDAVLDGIYKLLDNCTFSFVRQKHRRGLGDAILTGRHLVNDSSFGVILADDLCEPTDGTISVMHSMAQLHLEHGCSVLALHEVPEEKVDQYGIVLGEPIGNRCYRIRELVEKPEVGTAPSRLAVVGRYILTPDIFATIAETPPGRGGEIQITDALKVQAAAGALIGYQFEGHWFDCGDIEGYMQAINYYYGQQNRTGAV